MYVCFYGLKNVKVKEFPIFLKNCKNKTLRFNVISKDKGTYNKILLST